MVNAIRSDYCIKSCNFAFKYLTKGSTSALEKFLKRLEGTSSIKRMYVRLRDETTGETSAFKKFSYNNITLNIVRYLRDNLTIKDYNKVIVKNLKVTPDKSIYKLKVTL